MSTPGKRFGGAAAGLRVAVMLAAVAAAAACTGLPSKPAPVTLAGEAPLGDFTADAAAWPDAKWWRRYDDADLDRLIDMALEFSPTLATAHARVDSARESVRLAGASTGAHVQATGDGSRQRLSDNGLFPPQLLGFHWYNQFDLGLQASYTFDWWGKQRDTIEAAMDQAHAAAADRSAAALVLAASVADTYFGWQADQSRLRLAAERETTVAQEGKLIAARIRAQLEAADEADRAEANLAAVREQIALLRGSAALRLVTLAALVGRSPAELPTLTPKPLPAVRAGLPENVKIDLLARRADITASRWRVEAAERSRTEARAEFFPDFSITALAGLQSLDVGKLLLYNSRVPNVAAAVHLPIFDAGSLKARYGASQAALDSAVASYRDTVITAAEEVATQVTTRNQLAAERVQVQVAVDAAQRLQTSAAARLRQGVVDSRLELTATESWIQERDALLQLDAAALSADIGLQRALGGGYERNTRTP